MLFGDASEIFFRNGLRVYKVARRFIAKKLKGIYLLAFQAEFFKVEFMRDVGLDQLCFTVL